MFGIITNSSIFNVFQFLNSTRPQIEEGCIWLAPLIIKLHDGEIGADTGGIQLQSELIRKDCKKNSINCCMFKV
jgi:hypothetical protein